MTRVTAILDGLGLKLSPEKTRITTWASGYSFLGFWISRRSIRMRPKSLRKLEDKVRELTQRHYNFGPEVFRKLNPVLRGTAQYFATEWSSPRWQFRDLDCWIRRRLRAMKSKRFSYFDNQRYSVRWFGELGLLSLESFCHPKRRSVSSGFTPADSPSGATVLGSPGAGNPHAGKYAGLTASRQRGGSGLTATPLPTEPPGEPRVDEPLDARLGGSLAGPVIVHEPSPCLSTAQVRARCPARLQAPVRSWPVPYTGVKSV
jgi:hypothetical protein